MYTLLCVDNLLLMIDYYPFLSYILDHMILDIRDSTTNDDCTDYDDRMGVHCFVSVRSKTINVARAKVRTVMGSIILSST